MKPCPDCCTEIPAAAKVCAQCGHAFSVSKKRVSPLFGLIMIWLFVCLVAAVLSAAGGF